RSALDPGGALLRIDVDPIQHAQIGDDAGVDDGGSGHPVATAVDRERDVLLPGDVHGGDDVVPARAPRDQRGPAIDHRVEDAPQFVVRGVFGVDELAGEAGELEVCRAYVGHALPSCSNNGTLFHVGRGTGSRASIRAAFVRSLAFWVSDRVGKGWVAGGNFRDLFSAPTGGSKLSPRQCPSCPAPGPPAPALPRHTGCEASPSSARPSSPPVPSASPPPRPAPRARADPAA